MNVPSKTHYALRVLVDLELFGKKRPARVAEIADREQIPRQFLHQILIGLKGGGMVKSARGRHGGYMLATPAEEITVAAVVLVTQGSLLALPEGITGEGIGVDATVCEVWEKTRSVVEHELGSVSIRDLAERSVEGRSCSDYVI